MDESFAFDHDAREGSARRVTRRDSMFLQASTLREGDAHPVMLRVRNLSAGGLMAECSGVFEQGDRVRLDLRGIGTVSGRIVWRTEDRVGVAFEAPIDPKLARRPVRAEQAAPTWRRPPAEPRRPGLRPD